MGGRKYNYDFVFTFIDEAKTDKVLVKYEFKYMFSTQTDSSKYSQIAKINSLPQFFQVASNRFLAESIISYAEFFYKYYLTDIVSIMDAKSPLPSLDTYLKYIHNTNYSKISLIQELYNIEKKGENDIVAKKNLLVNQSITNYLAYTKLAINDVSDKLCQTQDSKRYMIFLGLKDQDGHVYTDMLKKEELTLDQNVPIKHIGGKDGKYNTIVYTTVEKNEIHMLLRWKNGKGILFPAWQISIKNRK